MLRSRTFNVGSHLSRAGILLKVCLTAVIAGIAAWMIVSAHMASAVGVAPTVRGATSATVGYNTNPKTIAAPPIVAGDLLIMIFNTDYESVTSMQLPSGFTERARREFDLGSNHMIIGTKIATGSEPSSYTYVAPTGGDTRVDLISVKDADPNSLPVIVTAETSASTTTHRAPSVAPAGINDLLISGVTLMSNPSNPGTTSWTPPSGMTELTDAQTGTIMTMTTASQALTGGATGTKTFTATAGTAVRGLSFSIAINGVDDAPNAVPAATTPSVRDIVIESDPWTDEAMTVARPNVVAGDLLVMNFLADWGTIDEMIVPTGFKVVYRLDRGQDKNHMVVATKVATGSEPASYSYSANTSADTRVDLLSIKDVDVSAPIVGAGVTTSTSVNYLTAPSVTPLGTNDLLLSSANFVHYPDPGVVTWTAPFGMTKKSDLQTAHLSLTTATEQLSAGGPTGARTFLGAPQTPQPGDAFSIAIKGLAGNTANIVPDATISSAWTASGNHTAIDEGETTTSDYVGVTGSTASATATFGMQNIVNVTQATSITLNVCSYSATNANGGTIDTLTNNISIGGVAQAAFTITPPYSATGDCKWERQTYSGVWTQTDLDSLQTSFVRNLLGTGSASAKADNLRIVSAYATVVYSTPPVVSQAAYRWFANDTAGALGAPLAAANTAANTPTAGAAARLRLNLGVGTGDLDAGTTYKLRYQLKSGTCSTNPALYSDVTTSSPIKFYDDVAAIDTSLYVSSANDPTRSGVVAVGQTYQESNSFKVVTPVLKNQDGLWDFALSVSPTVTPGTYCVMATKSDNTALATYSVIPEMIVPPPTFEQSSYRFYQNVDSVAPGNVLANQNTPATIAAGQAYRLRLLIAQTGGGATAISQTFKLQAAEKTLSCSATTYVDVTTLFTDNASVADEAAISATANDPTPSAGTVVTQTYTENIGMSVTTAMQAGNNGMWDVALKSAAADNGKTYCFRIVDGAGATLSNYAQYPEITFAVSGPALTEQLRGGQSVRNGTKSKLNW